MITRNLPRIIEVLRLLGGWLGVIIAALAIVLTIISAFLACIHVIGWEYTIIYVIAVGIGMTIAWFVPPE